MGKPEIEHLCQCNILRKVQLKATIMTDVT